MEHEPTTNESSVGRQGKNEAGTSDTPSKPDLSFIIPEACANGDEECEHTRKLVKHEYNPI